MSLQKRLAEDLKNALKSGKSFEAGVLRFVNASLQNQEIEKRGKGEESELSEEEIVAVFAREAKKRKESIKAYQEGGRGELAKQEQEELTIIERYLPEQMSREQIETKVKEIIEQTGAKHKKEFGKAMGTVMKELKGKADASTVSEVLKELLKD